MEVYGDKGALIFDGDQGTLMQAEGKRSIALGNRQRLFAKDTAMVLDYLIDSTSLYVTPEASLYTLKVADAAQRSTETGQTMTLE